jgi:hypothetical protein
MQQTNQQKLGEFVADTMERLDEDIPDAELAEIMLICELRVPSKDHEDEYYSQVRYFCSDSRPLVQIGLLRQAQLAAEDPEA